MKRLLSLTSLLVTALLLTVGCSGGQTAVSSPTAPTVAPQQAENGRPTPIPPTPTAPPDSTLSQIGMTGRPQFLNAYASW